MSTKLGNTSTVFEITIYARPHGSRTEPVVARASFFDRYEAEDWATENEEKAKQKYGPEYDVYYRMKVLGSNAHISPPRSLSAICDRELSAKTRADADDIRQATIMAFRMIEDGASPASALSRVAERYGLNADDVAEVRRQLKDDNKLSAICDRELRRVGLAEQFVVWIKEDGQWVEQGDGPMGRATADRVAREIKQDFDIAVKVLPVGQEP